ncbi:MAG: chromosome segregation protein SMC [Planctomycetes bacterium]|nr:chromosome segregation protein SMC [Planctomycetota bacterium]
MLKALELFGFKSFADKTRFEFPQGITVVVGPNGSGKSNVVDAIKWVLGEQSAKSLRGREMADVIFKGSGAGGRKMMNTAEATIIFDNSDGRLAIDGSEVHVTRRVYRSGEGEYLINGQPCRLKDIRDLFRGTGVGVDAYSLIEQGKVDQLLQASPKDRRAIFEEAAGISRFKAKKVEAQRRLERVAQNLLRLSDIVEEVESRLKNVQAQASKARRYREYAGRLQQLRTHVALHDWRTWTEKLDAVEHRCAECRDAAAGLQAKAESLEGESLEVDARLASIAESLHQAEGCLARNRERLAARASRCDMEYARRGELESESALHQGQLAAASGRVGDMLARLREVTEQVESATRDLRGIEGDHAIHEGALAECAGAWRQLAAQSESLRERHVERMREGARLGNQAERLASQLATLDASIAKSSNLAHQADREVDRCRSALAELLGQEGAWLALVRDRAGELDAAQQELAQSRRLLARRQEDAAELQGRRQGVARRIEILRELEDRREGVPPGVRQLLEAKSTTHSAEDGEHARAFAEIEGMVADLFRADVALAPLVDAALGEASQCVVVRGIALIRMAAQGALRLEGRAQLLSLERIPSRFEFRRVQWEGRRGVLGRADRLVQFDPRFRALAEYLLGRTYFVESLDHALEFHRLAPGRARFVTQACEVLQRDGVVAIGPPHSATSLVSRRSELESLRTEIESLDHKVESASLEIVRHSENIRGLETHLVHLSDARNAARESLADHRVHQRTLEQQFTHWSGEQGRHAKDQEAVSVERSRTITMLAEIEAARRTADDDVARLERELESGRREWERVDRERTEKTQELTRCRIALATTEQRLTTLITHRDQLGEARLERSRAIADARENLERCRNRVTACDRVLLGASSELALLYLEREAIQAEIAQSESLRSERAEHRRMLADELVQLRKRARRCEDQLHQWEIEAEQVRQQRAALVDRFRDEFGAEIGELEGDAAERVPPEERARIEEEIASLRRKISNIGAVNMEALRELDDLETRHGALAAQYRDLSQARDALERIIQKINGDSRRLFMETLEAIRANFQTIYRKAFGGGKADIVLEEGGDVLECGVDIVATPPGKPTFNNSLLSGGEKALTAVALLLAIFEFRPSPFCVLDEVDAPFDEANIGRFIDVLREFLGWTKFVIVTHSKKTMTAATTLYGVTMQESGVSKRVAVRFEDVSDNGEISSEAIRRSEGASETDQVA